MAQQEIEVRGKRAVAVLERRERAGKLLALRGDAEQPEPDADLRLPGRGRRRPEYLERHGDLLVVREHGVEGWFDLRGADRVRMRGLLIGPVDLLAEGDGVGDDHAAE
jgi:hypothetical protein